MIQSINNIPSFKFKTNLPLSLKTLDKTLNKTLEKTEIAV